MNFTYEVHLVADGKFGTQERVRVDGGVPRGTVPVHGVLRGTGPGVGGAAGWGERGRATVGGFCGWGLGGRGRGLGRDQGGRVCGLGRI